MFAYKKVRVCIYSNGELYQRDCVKTTQNPSEAIFWSRESESIELNAIPVFGQNHKYSEF